MHLAEAIMLSLSFLDRLISYKLRSTREAAIFPLSFVVVIRKYPMCVGNVPIILGEDDKLNLKCKTLCSMNLGKIESILRCVNGNKHEILGSLVNGNWSVRAYMFRQNQVYV